MKHIFAAAAALSAAVLASAALAQPPAASATQLKGQKLAHLARVSLAQARAIASKAHPGEITDQELEREKGGSGLRYSFDVKDHGKTFEVGVDAKTGRVLENAAEGAHPD